MNLAFAAVMVFLLFAPGVIFRRAYLSYPLSKRYAASSASDEVAYAAVPAVVLQFLMLETVQHMSSYRVDFVSLGDLLVGTHADAAQDAAFRALSIRLTPIAAYNLVLWFIAGLSGYIARLVVFKLELDSRWQVLRFNNDWYYLLTGRQWRLRRGIDFDVIWVDVLVKGSGAPTLYSGVLDYYFLARDGGMDSLSLSYAQRWPEPFAEKAKPIPGQSLILKYSEILNLNLAFCRLNETPAASAAEVQPQNRRESDGSDV